MKQSKISIPGVTEVQESLFAGTPDEVKYFTAFPEVKRDEKSFLQILESFDPKKGLGLDYEFEIKTHKPTIIGISSETEICSLPATEKLTRLTYEAVRDKNSTFVGYSVFGAEKPIIDAVVGETSVDMWDDGLRSFFLANSVLCKSTKDDTDEGGSLGFMGLNTAATFYLNIPVWKICRGATCYGPCPYHRVFDYNGIDAWAGLLVHHAALQDFYSKGGTYKTYRQKMHTGESCYEMERAGILTNRQNIENLDRRITDKKERLFEGTGFNPRSGPEIINKAKSLGRIIEKSDIKQIQKSCEKEFKTLGYGSIKDFEAIHGEGQEDFDPEFVARKLERFDAKNAEIAAFFYRMYKYKKSGKGTKSWFDDKYFNGAWLHPRFNDTGTSLGRLSSSKPNCFSPETEILTLTGWKAVNELSYEDKIANWYPGGIISFLTPINLTSREYTGNLIKAKNEHISFAVTEDHRIPLENRKTGVLSDCTAGNYSKDKKHYNAGKALYGRTSFSELTENKLRLLIAFQADGTYSWNKCEFSFKKKRKADRLRFLLQNSEFSFTENLKNNKYIFRVDQSFSVFCKKWLDEKCFTKRLLKEIIESNLYIYFCDEIFNWDGNYDRRDCYYSKHKINVEIVSAVFTLFNIRCRISKYTNKNGNFVYQCYMSNTNYSLTTNIEKEVVPVNNYKVYCLTVDSSYVITKHDDRICVMGQCQNIPRTGFGEEIRKCIIPPDGFDIVKMDFSNLELRIILWKAGFDVTTILKHDPFQWLVDNSNGLFDSVATKMNTGFSARDFAKSASHACVPGDTEILTKDGWIKIEDWKDQEIAIAHNGKIWFEKPEKYHHYYVSDPLIYVKNSFYESITTSNHRIPVVFDNQYLSIPASEISSYKKSYIPLAGNIVQTKEKYSDLEILQALAIQADGSKRRNSLKSWEFNVNKPRKKLQLEKLFSKACNVRRRNNKETYRLQVTYESPLLDNLKNFTKEFLTLSNRQMNLVLDNIVLWDGQVNTYNKKYSSTNLDNIKLVQTLCHLTNRSGFISIKSRNYINEKHKTCYNLTISDKNKIKIREMGISEVKDIHNVYCFTTSSGYFLIKQNDKISVTGNSNLLEGFTLLSKTDLAKPHTQKLITNGALRVFYDWTFRGKTVAFTGANLAERLLGSKTESNRKAMLELQWDIYFKSFPILNDFHRKLLAEIENEKVFRVPGGMILDLYGPDLDDAKISAAAVGQGGGAAFVQEAMSRFRLKTGLKFFCQVHDDVNVLFPESTPDSEIVDIMKVMVEPSDLLPGMICPAKILRGKNWAESDMKNLGKIY